MRLGSGWQCHGHWLEMLWKLETGLRLLCERCHLCLHGVEGAHGKLLLRLNDAHVDVLLMCSGNLLLMLLEDLNLLLYGKLFHCVAKADYQWVSMNAFWLVLTHEWCEL